MTQAFTKALRPHALFKKPAGPVVVIVMDGVGVGCGDAYDAVAQAHMATMQRVMAQRGHARTLKAHGTAVGLPSDDDMGNSEVGHNALGSGRVVKQGAGLVDDALASGALQKSAGFLQLARAFTSGGTLHVIGLLSDGGVHSRQDQIEGTLDAAARAGAKTIRCHVLTDGRDVPDHSAQMYVGQLERKLAALRTLGVDAQIASGGGRMQVTMDRYESDWRIVERGWQAHVLGKGAAFTSALGAVEGLRAAHPGISDQELPPFVVVDAHGKPVGPIVDGDAVLFANFRGDRALQISRAFLDDAFTAFDRVRRPRVVYAGMMEYDGDQHVPPNYLVEPPVIEDTSGEYLAHAGIRTFAVSETQKYGHVTYFWNGNRSGMFDAARETYLEVPSHAPPFDARPQMRAPEIAQALVEAVRSGRYDLIRANFANGDMVGHTGNLAATIAACQAVDAALAQVLAAVEHAHGVAIVTADHGNADDMALRNKAGAPLVDAKGAVLARTSHTLAPVPFALVGTPLRVRQDTLLNGRTPGLANVAATVMNLLGFEAPALYEPSLLEEPSL